MEPTRVQRMVARTLLEREIEAWQHSCNLYYDCPETKWRWWRELVENYRARLEPGWLTPGLPEGT